jgi:hypothetical protein
MGDDKDDIVVKGKIKDSDGKEHEIEIGLKKGAKDPAKKHREPDRIRIEVDGNDYTSMIIKAKKKKSDKEKSDKPEKPDEITVEWISSERNGIGGMSGIAADFALKVHCPEPGDDTDEPYVIIEISEKAHEQAKKAKDFGFPTLPEGRIKVKISEKSQDKLNDYFKDPDLPRKLF